jgi:CRISPR-associated exonuclease Cas4
MEESPEQLRVTGTLVAYHALCHRKAWLFANGIRPENQNALVQIGSSLHQHSFQRKVREVQLADEGVIDFLHIRKNEIHEVKKSSSKAAIDRIQAGFYLLWLNRRGIPITRAILRYPLEKKTLTVDWEPVLELQVKAHIDAVSALAKQEQPPKAVRISACYKCAYKELCFE